MLFGRASGVIPPRRACSSGLSGSLVVNHNLVVPTRGFHKAGVLFNWVTQASDLTYTFLRAVRISLLQPSPGEGLKYHRLEFGVCIGLSHLSTYADAGRSRVKEDLDVSRRGLFLSSRPKFTSSILHVSLA